MNDHAVRGSVQRGFANVETWVFDLDNTLYPHHLNLWQQVDARIRDYIVDFLSRMDHSEPHQLDPAGTVALREAKKVRRAALRRGGEEHVLEQAEQHFGMPRSPLKFASTLPEPLYPPRADNN